MPAFLISAAHKSSGKTTISLGIGAALRGRGLAVAPFKKGPDYIDPIWLGFATGRDCLNLDFQTMDLEEIGAAYRAHAGGADVALVEGNKGLFDGMDVHGSNSNAALCTLLDIPAVLVIDTRGMTRGIAPLLHGYTSFDANVDIAGVILNQVGGPRHEAKLRAAIEEYTDLPVLGAVRRDPDLEIRERHLGLVPGNEHQQRDALIDRLGAAVSEQVDLDRLLTIGVAPPAVSQQGVSPNANVTIAIARDAAFGFYYPDDLAAFAAAGARLVTFDALSSPRLPEADGLFIGGGFPETHMRVLEANKPLREDIRTAIESGMPAYAECGGMMYLGERIVWNDASAQMCGVLPFATRVCERPQGRGYVTLKETDAMPWPGGVVAPRYAHEFHYAAIESLPATNLDFAYEVRRGYGINGAHDGVVYKNLLAGFAHLRHVRANPWVDRFVAFVRDTHWRRL